MNRERMEAKWDQVKGLAKEKWGRLTDDDILAIKGKGERLKGKLRERYGISKEKAEEELDDFLDVAEDTSMADFDDDDDEDEGRIGYVVLWFLGAPAGVLFLLWLFLGNNIFGPG